jgi:hypothetical protein
MPQLDRVIFSVELNSFFIAFIIFIFFFPKILDLIKNLLMIRQFKSNVYSILLLFFICNS